MRGAWKRCRKPTATIACDWVAEEWPLPLLDAEAVTELSTRVVRETDERLTSEQAAVLVRRAVRDVEAVFKLEQGAPVVAQILIAHQSPSAARQNTARHRDVRVAGEIARRTRAFVRTCDAASDSVNAFGYCAKCRDINDVEGNKFAPSSWPD
jgi:hypothetical protein